MRIKFFGGMFGERNFMLFDCLLHASQFCRQNDIPESVIRPTLDMTAKIYIDDALVVRSENSTMYNHIELTDNMQNDPEWFGNSEENAE